MGLDITVIPTAEPVSEAELDALTCTDEECGEPGCEDGRWESGLVFAFAYAGFEASYAGLPEGRGTSEDCIGGAWMRPGGGVWGFRAGSYSGYSQFRQALCSAVIGMPAEVIWANPEGYRDQPFYELINFADNEGCIGPVAAAALAADFDAHRATVEAAWGPAAAEPGNFDSDEAFYLESYDHWQRACTDAGGTGLIVFH